MEFDLQPGKYVVAVSGGVDSVVLLDLLAAKSGLDLVVAHFDHGIRPDSASDAEFVHNLAKQYKLPFVSERVELGAQASEAAAREARYAFLYKVREQQQASAIITAHHQDDLLETAVLNMLRGTGRRGLTSLQSTNTIVRPLLYMPKSDILAYAAQRKLSWREDSTNRDERYTRNYIRHRLLVKLDADTRQQLLAALEQSRSVNTELEPLLSQLINEHQTTAGLDRRWFTSLPHDVSREVMATWLRTHGIADFDRPTIERLTVQCKVRPIGKTLDVLHGNRIVITKDCLALEASKR